MADGDVVKTNLLMHLKDAGGQHSRMAFGEDSTVTLAKAFLASYTKNAIVGASNVSELVCAEVAGGGAEDKEDNVDRKLIITAKDGVAGGKIRFVVSGWTGVETAPGEKGERVTAEDGATICAAWKTANALPNALIFLRGTPVQRV
jgi:hypothetical protein